MLSFALRSIASAYLHTTYVLSVGDKSTFIPREVLRWNERQKTTELNRAGWPEKEENLDTSRLSPPKFYKRLLYGSGSRQGFRSTRTSRKPDETLDAFRYR